MATAKIETPAVPEIYAQLLEVQKGLANIPKNGKMKFGATSYDYLRADDVQERINPLLSENDIIVKSEYEVETLERRGARDATQAYVYVHLNLTYVSARDGSTLSVSGVGESQAADDKSINKALTQAIKNVHRTTFQFASGEPEPDDKAPGGEERNTTPRAVEGAKKTGAAPKKPAPRAVGSSPSQKIIKEEYIDKGLYTALDLNDLASKHGLPDKGEERYGALLELLKKGEVA